VQELKAFAGLDHVELVVRLMSEPQEELGLANYETVISRPPYDLETERALLRDKKIRLLVTKNSGGNATKAKLDAARLEGAAVIMINRPPREPAEYVHTPMQAIQWLNAHGV
jgi:precorrin-6A/cobalt-precorrin-6A reductase